MDQGLHVELTAGSSGFSAAFNEATNRLRYFNNAAEAAKKEEEKLIQKLEKARLATGNNEKEIKKLTSALERNKQRQAEIARGIEETTTEIKQSTEAYKKNTVEANNNFNAVQKGSASATSALRSGFNVIKGMIVGYAGKTLYEALIGNNADFEQSLTSFEVLLQSADKAEALMGKLERMAAETPLETTDLKDATELLLSHGVAEEDVMNRLNQLGDVSRGNAEKFQRVTLAYSQMVAKGKVTGEELRQMTEAGVPLLKALADSMGVTTAELSKMIEKGQVGIPQLNQALKDMTSEGGQFFGMMEKQSKTFSGMLSTMSDNVTLFARDVGDEAFEVLKDEMEELLNTINTMSESGELDEIAEELGGSIAEAITTVAEFIKWLWEMRDVLIAGAGAVVGYKVAMQSLSIVQGMITGFQTFSVTLSNLNTIHNAGISISKLRKAAMLGEEAVTKLCTAAGLKDVVVKGTQVTATNAATGATVAFNTALKSNPIGLVVAAVGLLVGALVSYNMVAGDAETETEKLIKKVDELAVSYEDAKKSIDETKNSEIAYAEKAKALKEQLYELDDQLKSNILTEEEAKIAKDSLKSTVEQLNSLIPGLNLNINDETGAWNLQRKEIDSLTESFYKLVYAKAMYTAYSAKIDAAAETIAENEDIIRNEKAKSQDVEYVNGVPVFHASGSYNTAVKKAEENIENAKNDIAVYTTEMEKYRADYEDANGNGNENGTTNNYTPTSTTKTTSGTDPEKLRQQKVKDFIGGLEANEHEYERYEKLVTGKGESTLEDELQFIEDAIKRYEQYEEQIRRNQDMTAAEQADYLQKYREAREDLELKYYLKNKEIEEKAANDAKQAHKDKLEDSKAYIEERNRLNDWGADNEIAAIWRVIDRSDKAFADGILNYEEYMDELGGLLNMLEDATTRQIAAQEEALRERYQKEYDIKKAALEESIALRQEEFDQELAMLDELVKKRKEAQEDEDRDLRMQRLQTKLEYEMDEDNRRSLQKEIDKLQEEIDDAEFDREIERKRQQIEEAQKEAAEFGERQLSGMQKRFEEKMTGMNIAQEIYENLDPEALKNVGLVAGTELSNGIKEAINTMLEDVNRSLAQIAGMNTVNNTTTNHNYNFTSTVNGVENNNLASALTRGVKGFMERLYLMR